MSVPPLFTNYGKSTTDLFKKKFDFDPFTLKTINKSKANGLTIESGAVSASKKSKDGNIEAFLRGYTKLALSRPTWGSGEAELHTDKDQTSKLQVKLTKLQPGLALTLAASSKDKAALFKDDGLVASAEATYNRPSVNAALTLKSDIFTPKFKIDGSLSFGVNDNLSLGAGFSTSQGTTKSASFKVTDVQEANLGVEYSQADLTVSLYSSVDKDNKFVNGSIFHNISRNLTQGASWKYNTSAAGDAKDKHTVTLGSDLRLGPDTGLKSKIELPKGNWQLAVEHRLENPQVLIGFASEYDVSTSVAPVSKNFGVSLTFGEF